MLGAAGDDVPFQHAVRVVGGLHGLAHGGDAVTGRGAAESTGRGAAGTGEGGEGGDAQSQGERGGEKITHDESPLR